MKINEDTLRYLLVQVRPSCVGSLLHQSPGKSTKSKHLKLVSNILFYYTYTDGQREHVGFFVVDNCQCSLVGVPGQPSRMFSVIFEGDGGRKHYFTTTTVEECQSWISALRNASYQKLKDKFNTLRVQVMSLTGTDPLITLQDKALSKIIPSTEITSKESRKHIKTKKVASTFYTGSTQMDTMPKRERPHSSGPKSKFFANLHVVRASDSNGNQSTQHTQEPQRTVSSGIETLRRQAMSGPSEVPSGTLVDI